MSNSPADPLPETYEAERAVISVALDDPKRFFEISGIIRKEDFSLPDYGIMWERIGSLAEKSIKPTLFKLREVFGGDSSWEFVRNALIGFFPIPSEAVEYAHHLAGRSRLRRMAISVDLLHDRVRRAHTAEDAQQAFETAFVETCGIATGSKGFRRASQSVADLETRLAKPTLAPRYRTGFAAADRMLNGGLKPKTFVVIAGRTGGGKTVLAMNLAVQFALDGIPVAVFSLEMDDVDLITRCVLSEGVHHSEDEAIEIVRKLPLFTDDTSDVTLKSIVARVKMMILRHECKVFIVDYLQLIGADGQERESRERIVAGMSRLLKVTAKETGCCIIALSQLNEAMELRESRAIEQDADVVLYVLDNDKGDAFLRITKQRGGQSHGPIKRMKEDSPGIPLRWIKENFRFSEL